jgi:hypothetical protein
MIPSPYPLIPENAIVSIILDCRQINRINGGIIITTPDAAVTPTRAIPEVVI